MAEAIDVYMAIRTIISSIAVIIFLSIFNVFISHILETAYLEFATVAQWFIAVIIVIILFFTRRPLTIILNSYLKSFIEISNDEREYVIKTIVNMVFVLIAWKILGWFLFEIMLIFTRSYGSASQFLASLIVDSPFLGAILFYLRLIYGMGGNFLNEISEKLLNRIVPVPHRVSEEETSLEWSKKSEGEKYGIYLIRLEKLKKEGKVDEKTYKKLREEYEKYLKQTLEEYSSSFNRV